MKSSFKQSVKRTLLTQVYRYDELVSMKCEVVFSTCLDSGFMKGNIQMNRTKPLLNYKLYVSPLPCIPALNSYRKLKMIQLLFLLGYFFCHLYRKTLPFFYLTWCVLFVLFLKSWNDFKSISYCHLKGHVESMFQAANMFFFPALSEHTCKCVKVQRQHIQIKIPLPPFYQWKHVALHLTFCWLQKNVIKLNSDIFKVV